MNLESLKNILVYIGFEKSDASLLTNLDSLAEKLSLEHVTFVHIAKGSDLPDGVRSEYFKQDRLDQLRSLLETHVRQYSSLSNYASSFEAMLGSPLQGTLSLSKKISADLILVTKDIRNIPSTVFAERLAHRAPSSLFLVSPDISKVEKRIFVPVDFSENSRHALEIGIQFAKRLNKTELTIFRANAHPVPHTKTGLGLDYERFTNDVEKGSERKLQRFLETVDFQGIAPRSLFAIDSSAGNAIVRELRKQQHGICIMGARGHNSLTNILLGSTTEEVIRQTDTPILIVKQKDGDPDTLDQILNKWFK